MLPSEFRTVLSTYPILFIEKSLQKSPWIFVDGDDDDDDDVDDELFCGTVDWRKAFNLSQLGPFSEILIIANLQYAVNRMQTWTETEFRFRLQEVAQ